MHPENGIIYVTSMYSQWYRGMQAVDARDGGHFERTVLERFPENGLIIYHEDDLPPVPGACMFDLRQLPWLEHELTDPTSGLNTYSSNVSHFADPLFLHPRRGDIKVSHTLFLKVVSIHHAVSHAPEGGTVF
jgi:hypothetical protein